jgi:hypothetical protein
MCKRDGSVREAKAMTTDTHCRCAMSVIRAQMQVVWE